MSDDNILKRMVFADTLRRTLRASHYDPITGKGCYGMRSKVSTPVDDLPEAMVPDSMIADGDYRAVVDDATGWKKLRCKHDFEYWAATCVVVKDKVSERDIPFVLNPPQRRVLSMLEEERVAGNPIRIILLKARQWGGSTLVQMYMAWIQSCHRRNWHSVICAHNKDTASGIRGMYTKMLANYPMALWDGDGKPQFKPYEGAANVRVIAGRNCRVTIGSSENPDSVRGADYAMAHLSETAYWRESRSRSPRSVIQAVCGAVGLLPYSLVVIESTAHGIGDYFHTEWVRSKGGRSDKRAVFVPWYEIEYYRYDYADAESVLSSLSDYELGLWRRGCDSGQIEWRRRKMKEFESATQFNAEFPGSDTEAFADSSDAVFSISKVEILRKGCDVMPRIGEVTDDGRSFTDDDGGAMKIWTMPEPSRRYVVAVDVGGRAQSSDWSVVAVLTLDGDRPAVVAQWRGHIDHDLLARKSVAVARFYNSALLVIESNTYETADYGGSSDSNLFILWRLAEEYPNVYRRESYDTFTRERTTRIGFHTNRATKALLIAGLIEAVREGAYVERDPEACNELLTYRSLPNGVYAAKQGHHDDILMTRAIALHVIRVNKPMAKLPKEFTQWQRWYRVGYCATIGV